MMRLMARSRDDEKLALEVRCGQKMRLRSTAAIITAWAGSVAALKETLKEDHALC